MRSYSVLCRTCGLPVRLKAHSRPDALRMLNGMTNCPSGAHLALPSLLSHVAPSTLREEEKREEKVFQELDTPRRPC